MADQGAGRNSGQGAGKSFVQFSRGAAQRIAKVVRTVESGNRDQSPLGFDHPLTPTRPLRLGTFTGAWQTGSWKTVTLYGTTQTASVYNWTSPVVVSSGSSTCKRFVVFGVAAGTQSLVEVQLQHTACTCVLSVGGVDLTQLVGYSADHVQVLGHNTTGPCLQWYSVATCATSTAA